MTTRQPAVAGTFYPAGAAALADLVDRLVAGVGVPADERPAAAYVVPHAGYRYSGPVAAEVYARLRRHAPVVGRVVLIGPAHRVPLAGCAVTGAERWRTPLGEVPIDVAGARSLASAGLAVVDDGPHVPEHSLEVQIPFLQRVLGGGVPILPICVGVAPTEDVAAVIAAATDGAAVGDGVAATDGAAAAARGGGGPATVVLCSTDLSHYLPDEQARERDRATADAVLALTPERIGRYDACGRFALRGLLRWARGAGLRPVRLALATSADTAGDPARVVGYPAFALSYP